MLRTVPRSAVVVGALVLALGAAGCMVEGPDGSVSVHNQTDRTLTIYYDNPDPASNVSPQQQEEMNTLTVLEPDQNTNFNVPGQCARAPVEAIDENGVVVDSLPAGTCHDDDDVRWTITDDE